MFFNHITRLLFKFLCRACGIRVMLSPNVTPRAGGCRLVLPSKSDVPGVRPWLAILLHELYHILYTDGWGSAKLDRRPQLYLNCLEDIRIDAKIFSHYPWSRQGLYVPLLTQINMQRSSDNLEREILRDVVLRAEGFSNYASANRLVTDFFLASGSAVMDLAERARKAVHTVELLPLAAELVDMVGHYLAQVSSVRLVDTSAAP